MEYPLEGIRVLDLSRLLPGPLCSLLLADLGAEVVKLEPPEGGDYARWYPPVKNEVSGLFAALNRNKRSLTVNLKSEGGPQLIKRIIPHFDILIESFRPGVMENFGLSYNQLSQLNPRLIYCSITGYGQTGPLADRAGHDINYLARSGLLSLQPLSERGTPTLPGIQIADTAGGSYFALIQILAALYAREKTGQGCHCDISITEGLLPLLTLELGKIAVGSSPSTPGRDLLNGGAPAYNVYKCRDGKFIAIGALEPKFWFNLAAELELPEEFLDSHLSLHSDGEALRDKLTEIFLQRDRDEWLSLLSSPQLCAEPVLALEELPEDPHLKERGLWEKHRHPTEGELKLPKTPFKMGSFRTPEHTPAPLLGEHTEEILKELGFSESEIAELKEQGVITTQ